MKYLATALFLSLLCWSISAMASEDYVCNHGDAQRMISVVYENDQEPVPCEVQYDKGEGVQTLWNAQAEAGYCENKAAEFIEKQESWGWSCEKMTQSSAAEDLHSDLY